MKLGTPVMVLVSVMLSAVAQKPETEPDSKPPVLGLGLGERLDDNGVLIDLDGHPHKLRELLGKLTVRNRHAKHADLGELLE